MLFFEIAFFNPVDFEFSLNWLEFSEFREWISICAKDVTDALVYRIGRYTFLFFSKFILLFRD